ncbi:MAG: 2-hydroxyacid dehydrogenase, partial [Anaerotignum sp.]|nr:2-hydroxyacid dehydrogenase [Anaerotignum sp.]
PAYSPESVAEQGAALLMTINRNTHLGWDRTTKFNFDIAGLTGICLAGKTAGVIGTGKIGQCMINILKGYGMKIVAYDAFPNPNLGLDYVTLDELYAQSDVISIHCPLMPATKHMINAEAISKMKDGVIFINVARGGLVDSEALADALDAGKFRGVGADVCEKEHEYFFENCMDKEKDPTLARLLANPKFVLSGHQAFLTVDALEQMALITLDNYKAFLAGAELVNEVK